MPHERKNPIRPQPITLFTSALSFGALHAMAFSYTRALVGLYLTETNYSKEQFEVEYRNVEYYYQKRYQQLVEQMPKDTLNSDLNQFVKSQDFDAPYRDLRPGRQRVILNDTERPTVTDP